VIQREYVVRELLRQAEAGGYREATAEAESWIMTDDVLPTTCYNAACVFAVSSKSARLDRTLSKAVREGLADAYATRAVALLHRAAEGGYFNIPDQLDYFLTDSDLDPIRRRKDFLEFKDDLPRK
jgi:hypothetical protein